MSPSIQLAVRAPDAMERMPASVYAELMAVAKAIPPELLLARLREAGRVPPHDLDAEAAVVGTLMLDPSALPRVADLLTPEHFYSLAHGRIFQAVQYLAAKATPIDAIGIASWLRTQRVGGTGDTTWLQSVGGTARLSELIAAAPTSFYVVGHAQTVREKWRLRTLIASCQTTAAEGYHAPDSLALIASLGVVITDLARGGKAAGRSLDSVAAEVWTEMMSPTEASPPQWSWPSCQQAFGSFVEREVTYLAARPEAGKTSLSFQVAEGIAETEPDENGVCEAVLYLSLEMDRGALYKRQLGIRAGVPARLIRDRVLHNDGVAVSKLIEAQKGWSTLPLILEDFDGEEPTIERIEGVILSAREALAHGTYRGHNGRRFPKCRLRTVMVDHFGQIKSPAPHNAGMPEKLGETAKGIKGMAKRTNTHVLVIAHAGTRAEDRSKDLTMKDVFGSSGPERYADSIIFLTRPEEHTIKLTHGKSRGDAKATEPVLLNFGRGLVWEG